MGLAAAGAHRHDSKLLEPAISAAERQLGDTLPENPTLRLDSACNGKACAAVLQAHSLAAVIAAKGVKAPIQAGKRWPVERTNSWMNDFGEVGTCPRWVDTFDPGPGQGRVGGIFYGDEGVLAAVQG